MVHSVSPDGVVASECATDVVWVFRRDRRRWLEEWRRGERSREFFYGLLSLRDHYRVGFAEDESSNPFHRPWYPLERLVARRVGMGFALDVALRNLPALNRARVLISTVDACGLPLALLKRVGALRSRLIYVSQGLSDRIEAYGREKWLPRWYRRLLLGVEELVTLSAGAGSALAAWLGVPDDRVRVLPFGTDHEFWANSAVGAVGAYVLSVGSDAGRDYATLLAASGDEPIHVVTRQPLSLEGRRNVVHTSRHSPRELRDLYSHARFVVIPLREGSQPSGQSAALQAMACGKAVVLTKTIGWWGETFLRDGDNCLVVPPGDAAALRAAIARLAAAPGDCARLGARARETVVAHFSETRMVKRLDELIAAQFQA